jgi:hypothetical protein
LTFLFFFFFLFLFWDLFCWDVIMCEVCRCVYLFIL